MYDISQNEMVKCAVQEKYSSLFMRSQGTVNTLAIPSTNKKVINFCEKNKVRMTNFKHFLFGGEVYSKEAQMRIASNDLIIVEQETVVESRFI